MSHARIGAVGPGATGSETGGRNFPLTILLRGGPSGVAPLWQAAGGELPEKVAVAFYGRHEHFVRTAETEAVDGRQLPVFQWSYSTKIAE
ncbi:DUF5988 family protein [Streptomyces sp. NPDC001667]